MVYKINKTNGDLVATVPEGEVDTSTSIRLVGKNFQGYGEIIGEDLISMLENFSGPTVPSNPIAGQLWYNSLDDLLYLYDVSNSWRPLHATFKGTMQRALVVKDVEGNSHKIIVDYVNDIPVMIISSDDPFVPAADAANIHMRITQAAFPVIRPGLNLNADPTNVPAVKVNGYITDQEFLDVKTELTNADTALSARIDQLLDKSFKSIYPIGSVYTSTVSANPRTFLGFGTWVPFGSGRVLIGAGDGYTAGEIGGSTYSIVPTHTHDAATVLTDLGHSHGVSFTNSGTDSGPDETLHRARGGPDPITSTTATTGITATTTITETGTSGDNANMQPYIVVYMWNRVEDAFVAPIKDTLLRTECRGDDKWGYYADGNNGEYSQLIEANSTDCGYVAPPPPPITIDMLIVGGGGAGGSGVGDTSGGAGGGGGGGGYLTDTLTLTGRSFSLPIIVGAGGLNNPASALRNGSIYGDTGGDSSVEYSGSFWIAHGGIGGAWGGPSGTVGGNGGSIEFGGDVISGNLGGKSRNEVGIGGNTLAAGGGAGGDDSNSTGAGGAGPQWINGKYYSGGGGAGGCPLGATGGIGGGGSGSIDRLTAGASGTTGTGGGGGGGFSGSANGNSGDWGPAGNGGSGTVIISYVSSTQLLAGGDATYDAAQGRWYHTFLNNGVITAKTTP